MYYIVAGDEWERPSLRRERMERAEEETPARVERLVSQLRGIDRLIERLNRLLSEEDEVPSPDDDDRRGSLDWDHDFVSPLNGWPRVPRTWRAQAGGGGGGGPQPPRPDDDEDDLEGVRERLAEAEERREQIIDELNDLGYDETGARLEDDLAAEEQEYDLLPLLAEDADEIRVWMHDLTVEEGETYRYALQLEVTNPLFAFQNRAPDAQKAFASQPTMLGERSGWTEGVAVPRRIQYFVTSAEPARLGTLGVRDASATIQAFVFMYG
jgi:hypothetical protein